jgi:hypothetical protein
VSSPYAFIYQERDRRSGEVTLRKVLYDPQPKQAQLHASTARNVMYGGAAMGGKSHGGRWHAYIAAARVRKMQILFLRRQFTELEQTHLLHILTELPAGIARYDQSKHRLTFPGTGSLIQFGHAQAEKDIRSYLSTEWDLIVVDEASEFTPWMLKMLTSRLRTTKAGVVPQIVYLTNPGGEAHQFLKDRFITKHVNPDEDPTYRPADYQFIPALVGDNKYATAEYVTRLEALPQAEREAYLFGNWDAFAGQYFSEWNRTLHTVPPFAVPEWWERAGGMDYGYDPNPAWVGLLAYDEHGLAIGYREFVMLKTAPSAIAERLHTELPFESEHGLVIYHDPSMAVKNPESGIGIAATINERLAELHSQISLVPANNDRLNGWARVHGWLDVRRKRPDGTVGPYLRLMQHDPTTNAGMPYLIETLPAMVFDDSPGRVGDLKKANGYFGDHGCDGLRYAMMAREPLSAVPEEVRGATPHHLAVHTRTKKLLAIIQQRQRAADTGETLIEGEADEGPSAEVLIDVWQ